MLLEWIILYPLLGIIFAGFTKNDNVKKDIAILFSSMSLLFSILIFILFDYSNPNYQFIGEILNVGNKKYYIGVNGLSIYFVLLTTFITPIVIYSNFFSIKYNIQYFYTLVLLLESLLILVFIVLDILLFYIFFESTLIPLFLIINTFGSEGRNRASFYIFIYTLIGSLFLLIAILAI